MIKLTEETEIYNYYDDNTGYEKVFLYDLGEELMRQILEQQKIVERLKEWQDSLDDFQPHSSTWSEIHIHDKIDEILGKTSPEDCK